jgi:hypothetical protein
MEKDKERYTYRYPYGRRPVGIRLGRRPDIAFRSRLLSRNFELGEAQHDKAKCIFERKVLSKTSQKQSLAV